MAVFPSAEWFDSVRNIYNSDSSLHSGGGGACHTRAGLRIGSQDFLIVFDGLECSEARPAESPEMATTDFVIEMTTERWCEMVANIQANGHADLDHTLNSLDLSEADGIARSPVDDQYRQDLFYRYNQNFQDFFDASSRVPTTFD